MSVSATKEASALSNVKKDDRYTLIAGEDLVVLFDARVDSATHGLVQTVVLSPSGVRQVLIPRGVWHFNIALGNEEAQLVNHPTAPYRHSAPDRLMLSWDSPVIPVDIQKYFPNQLKAPQPTEDC